MKDPKSLKQLWSEDELCKRLALRKGKGHSLVLSHWVRMGLKTVEISKKRFFWEHDIIDFLLKRGRDISEEDKGTPDQHQTRPRLDID